MVGRAKAHLGDAHPGLERAAYELLFHLVCDGPMRLGALAEAVHVDASTVSRQVAALVDAGLVERQPEPSDRRAAALAATARGAQLYRTARRHRTERLTAVLADWSPDDVDAFVGLLRRFNDDFERHRPRTAGDHDRRGEHR